MVFSSLNLFKLQEEHLKDWKYLIMQLPLKKTFQFFRYSVVNLAITFFPKLHEFPWCPKWDYFFSSPFMKRCCHAADDIWMKKIVKISHCDMTWKDFKVFPTYKWILHDANNYTRKIELGQTRLWHKTKLTLVSPLIAIHDRITN
jgi:hypothetical protein